jgi:glycosyltransferase involved in cell wall biosynthesis/predicted metal-dependent phosphoesterase TrpH
MRFVTITDHDTIDGCLELSDSPDVFISEELTAWFPGEPQAVHVLCFGLTPDDHARLQQRRHDVEACAEYLHANEIVCALAHPYFAVEAALTPRHFRVLAQLFSIWETLNGSRPREQNGLAQSHIDIAAGTGIGGSDDHAGVDIGKTYTETQQAQTPDEFLRLVANGAAAPGGEHGSPAKSAHSALVLATRSIARDAHTERLSAESCMRIVSGIVEEGGLRQTATSSDFDHSQAARLLETWYRSVGLRPFDAELIRNLQSDELSHADLYRRACRAHEREVKQAVSTLVGLFGNGSDCDVNESPAWAGDIAEAVVTACAPAIPYAPAEVFAAQERARAQAQTDERLRVALIVDGIGGMHGVTRTISELRDRGVDGCDVCVVGTDAEVDHRLPSAIDIDVPFYNGLEIGVPTVTGVVGALVNGNYDLVHITSPGPANLLAAAVAQVMGLPLVASYHTELSDYAAIRSKNLALGQAMQTLLRRLYAGCELVLSPSPSSDRSLGDLGIPANRIQRWNRGVDLTCFTPAKRKPLACPGNIRVLYAGRLAAEKGCDLLAEGFLAARSRHESLHLLVAGRGPEESQLQGRLGSEATFFGWLDHDELAELYASADMFVFPSTTDTFGQVILEAQASGLPVVSVNAGGPASLIQDGANGLLCQAKVSALSAQIELLASRDDLRRRLRAGGLDTVRQRSWEAALGQLAAGYTAACKQGFDTDYARAA